MTQWLIYNIIGFIFLYGNNSLFEVSIRAQREDAVCIIRRTKQWVGKRSQWGNLFFLLFVFFYRQDSLPKHELSSLLGSISSALHRSGRMRYRFPFSKLIYNENSVCQLRGSVFCHRLLKKFQKTPQIKIAKQKTETFVVALLPKVGNLFIMK